MAVVTGSRPVVRPIRPRREPKPAGTPVGALVAERAAEAANAVALVNTKDGRTVTWGDVAEAAEEWRGRFAEELASGVTDDVRVGLSLSSPLAFGREYLGALAAGVPIAPLDPRCSAAELLWASAALGLTHVLGDDGDLTPTRRRRQREPAGPRLVGDFPLAAGGIGPNAFGGGRAWHPSMAPTPASLPSYGDGPAPAVVIATRGTSGPPKLVPFTQRQLLIAATRTVRHLQLGRRDRGYLMTALRLIDSQVVGLLATLVSGGSLAVGGFDRRTFWQEVELTGATWLNLAPVMVTSLVEVAGPGAEVRKRLRFARVAGAGLGLRIHSNFSQSSGVSLLETYTVTEAAGTVTADPLDVHARRPGSAGRPVGVELRIVDADYRVVPVGTTGRIQLRGATVVTHYLSYGRQGGMSPIPARRPDGWFDTGDLGYGSPEGRLVVVGRAGTLCPGLGDANGAAERSSQVACGTPASPLRAAAFRP